MTSIASSSNCRRRPPPRRRRPRRVPPQYPCQGRCPRRSQRRLRPRHRRHHPSSSFSICPCTPSNRKFESRHRRKNAPAERVRSRSNLPTFSHMRATLLLHNRPPAAQHQCLGEYQELATKAASSPLKDRCRGRCKHQHCRLHQRRCKITRSQRYSHQHSKSHNQFQ